MRVGNTIYLDYQSTTPLDARVLAEMNPYLVGFVGNPHSADHALGWQTAQAVEDATAKVANLIGADADEIIFTSGATESNNLALLGLGRRATGGKRHRILVSAIEHKCVLAAARRLNEELGYQLELLPVDQHGFVNIDALTETMSEDVLLVSIMAVNNEIGTIQDIRAISKVLREYGALFHCDAAQGPCAIDLDSIAEHVDLLSLSAHKMYGPMGIGALFIQRDLHERIEPLVYGGGQQQNLRSGTLPVALCVGMGAAAAMLGTDEAKEERAALHHRRDRFVRTLMRLPYPAVLNGAQCSFRHPGNANVRFSGFSAQDLLAALQPHVAASTGSACTSGIPEPSHVLKAIGLTVDEADSAIRFSLGRDTSEADLDDTVQVIGETLSQLARDGLMLSA